MARAAYPTGADLLAYLTSMGVSAGTLDLDSAAAAGVAEFEGRVDRVMLAGATSTARAFSPPTSRDGFLDLEGDLALPATTGALAYQPEGATASAFLPGTDYLFLPQNASARGLPYTYANIYRMLSFPPFPRGLHRAIVVTGRWGYGTTIPDDAWVAMRNLGMLSIQEALWRIAIGSAGFSPYIKTWRNAAGVSETYVTAAEWIAAFRGVLQGQGQGSGVDSVEQAVLRYVRGGL